MKLEFRNAFDVTKLLVDFEFVHKVVFGFVFVDLDEYLLLILFD